MRWSRKNKPRAGVALIENLLQVAVFSIRCVMTLTQLHHLRPHYCIYQSNFSAFAVWPNSSRLLFKLMDFVGSG